MSNSSAPSCGSDRSLYAAAATKVAVAQIAQSVGFRTAQPVALRSLSDLAGRYLEALGKIASSAANSQGRTECNILDVVLALERLSSPRGFPGASEPRTPFLRSEVLRGIIVYVDTVDEVPFARSIYSGVGSGVEKKLNYPSFELAGRDPPSHVPRWLPVFPESTGKAQVKKLRAREDLWPGNKGLEVELDPGIREGVRADVRGFQGRVLPSKRHRVRFELGLDMKQIVKSQEIEARWSGRTNVIAGRWENEEDGNRFIGSAKELCRHGFSVQSLVGLGASSGFPD